MSSDPYTYVGAHPRGERAFALELRRRLDEYPIIVELSREDAHRLLSGIANALFATASHDPRPATPSPVTDNDEIEAIVGALAALTDRVSALEEDTDIGNRLVRLEAHANIARQNFRIGKERLDDIEGRVSSLLEMVDVVRSCLGKLEFGTAATAARITRLETPATPSTVTPAPERGSNPHPQTLQTRQRDYAVTTYGGPSDSEKKLHQELYDLMCRYPGVESIHATRVAEEHRP